MPENVRKLGSQEGYLPEYLLSCTTVLLAPGQFALNSLCITEIPSQLSIFTAASTNPVSLYSYYRAIIMVI